MGASYQRFMGFNKSVQGGHGDCWDGNAEALEGSLVMLRVKRHVTLGPGQTGSSLGA